MFFQQACSALLRSCGTAEMGQSKNGLLDQPSEGRLIDRMRTRYRGFIDYVATPNAWHRPDDTVSSAAHTPLKLLLLRPLQHAPMCAFAARLCVP